MHQIYTLTKKFTHYVHGLRHAVSVVVFIISTFLLVIWNTSSKAQSSSDEITIVFEGSETNSVACSKIDDLAQSLMCYKNSGFPYAAMCTQSLQDEICSGPRVRIAEFYFTDRLPFRNSLIEALGGFRHGQFYNHRQIQSFITVLNERLEVMDVSITFEQIGVGSVKMLVDGETPKNSISTGLSLDHTEGFIGTLSGRHFLWKNTPGFFEYYLHGSDTGLSEVGVSLPISTSPNSMSRIGATLYNADQHYVELTGTALKLDVIPYSGNVIYFPRVSSYGARIHYTTFSSDGWMAKTDKYLSTFASWNLRAPVLFDKSDIGSEAYLLSGNGVTSKLSFSGSGLYSLTDNSELTLRNSTNIDLMFGPITGAPINERIFLGGKNLRGFYPREIGRMENGGFEDWGGRFSLTSQFELVRSLPIKLGEVSFGVHTDFGIISDNNLDIDGYGSIGLISEFGFSRSHGVKLSVSKNNISPGDLIFSLNFSRK